MIKLSDSCFTIPLHIEKGPKIDPEIYGDVPEGEWVLNKKEKPLQFPSHDFNDRFSDRECQGLDIIHFRIYGRDRIFAACRSGIDRFFNNNPHHKIYKMIADNIAKSNGWDGIRIDYTDNRNDRGLSSSPVHLQELVVTWGYGQKLYNIIDTPKFIQLCRDGEIPDEREYTRHATGLLHCMGLVPTLDPVKKLIKAADSAKNMTELLRSMAHFESMNRYNQHKHPYFNCNTW